MKIFVTVIILFCSLITTVYAQVSVLNAREVNVLVLRDNQPVLQRQNSICLSDKPTLLALGSAHTLRFSELKKYAEQIEISLAQDPVLFTVMPRNQYEFDRETLVVTDLKSDYRYLSIRLLDSEKSICNIEVEELSDYSNTVAYPLIPEKSQYHKLVLYQNKYSKNAVYFNEVETGYHFPLPEAGVVELTLRFDMSTDISSRFQSRKLTYQLSDQSVKTEQFDTSISVDQWHVIDRDVRFLSKQTSWFLLAPDAASHLSLTLPAGSYVDAKLIPKASIDDFEQLKSAYAAETHRLEMRHRKWQLLDKITADDLENKPLGVKLTQVVVSDHAATYLPSSKSRSVFWRNTLPIVNQHSQLKSALYRVESTKEHNEPFDWVVPRSVGHLLRKQIQFGRFIRLPTAGLASVSPAASRADEPTTENIYFDLDKYHLRESEKYKIKPIVNLTKNNPNTMIQLGAHTDSQASDAYNITLSLNRLNTIKQALVAMGVAPARISGAYYGEQRPAADNSSPSTRQLNRRVEIQLLPAVEKISSIADANVEGALFPIPHHGQQTRVRLTVDTRKKLNDFSLKFIAGASQQIVNFNASMMHSDALHKSLAVLGENMAPNRSSALTLEGHPEVELIRTNSIELSVAGSEQFVGIECLSGCKQNIWITLDYLDEKTYALTHQELHYLLAPMSVDQRVALISNDVVKYDELRWYYTPLRRLMKSRTQQFLQILQRHGQSDSQAKKVFPTVAAQYSGNPEQSALIAKINELAQRQTSSEHDLIELADALCLAKHDQYCLQTLLSIEANYIGSAAPIALVNRIVQFYLRNAKHQQLQSYLSYRLSQAWNNELATQLFRLLFSEYKLRDAYQLYHLLEKDSVDINQQLQLAWQMADWHMFQSYFFRSSIATRLSWYQSADVIKQKVDEWCRLDNAQPCDFVTLEKIAQPIAWSGQWRGFDESVVDYTYFGFSESVETNRYGRWYAASTDNALAVTVPAGVQVRFRWRPLQGADLNMSRLGVVVMQDGDSGIDEFVYPYNISVTTPILRWAGDPKLHLGYESTVALPITNTEKTYSFTSLGGAIAVQVDQYYQPSTLGVRSTTKSLFSQQKACHWVETIRRQCRNSNRFDIRQFSETTSWITPLPTMQKTTLAVDHSSELPTFMRLNNGSLLDHSTLDESAVLSMLVTRLYNKLRYGQFDNSDAKSMLRHVFNTKDNQWIKQVAETLYGTFSWQSNVHVDSAAGITEKMLSGWQPESSAGGLRKAFLDQDKGYTLVDGQQERRWIFNNTASQQVMLSMELSSMFFAEPAPLVFDVLLNGRVLLANQVVLPNNRYHSNITLNKGQHVIVVRPQYFVRNQILWAKMVVPNEQNPSDELATVQRQYYVADKTMPVKAVLNGPAIYRVALHEQNKVEVQYIDVSEPSRLVEFKATNDPVLLRLHQLDWNTSARKNSPFSSERQVSPLPVMHAAMPEAADLMLVEENTLHLNNAVAWQHFYGIAGYQRQRPSGQGSVPFSTSESFSLLGLGYRYTRQLEMGNFFIDSKITGRSQKYGLNAYGIKIAADLDLSNLPLSLFGDAEYHRDAKYNGWRAAIGVIERQQLDVRWQQTLSAKLFFSGQDDLDNNSGIPGRIDSNVWSWYRQRHPRGIELSDRFAYRFDNDLIGFARAAVVSDEDFRLWRPDRFATEFGAQWWWADSSWVVAAKPTYYFAENKREWSRRSNELTTKLSLSWLTEAFSFANYRLTTRIDAGYRVDSGQLDAGIRVEIQREHRRLHRDLPKRKLRMREQHDDHLIRMELD